MIWYQVETGEVRNVRDLFRVLRFLTPIALEEIAASLNSTKNWSTPLVLIHGINRFANLILGRGEETLSN